MRKTDCEYFVKTEYRRVMRQDDKIEIDKIMRYHREQANGLFSRLYYSFQWEISNKL